MTGRTFRRIKDEWDQARGRLDAAIKANEMMQGRSRRAKHALREATVAERLAYRRYLEAQEILQARDAARIGERIEA